MIAMDAIELKLQNIFLKHTGIDFFHNESLKDEKFFGRQIGLPARELVLIFFDIEKEFEIEIPQDIIEKGDFDCYAQVVNIVYVYCNEEITK